MQDKIKLLMVDDETVFLNSMAQRLELRDFEVIKASNATEALEVVENNKFDIALLDLKMPGIDGKELLKILKDSHSYIEVIMLTGHGSLDSAVECTKLGAFDYLSKPCEFGELVNKLKEAYETRLRKKFVQDSNRMDKLISIASAGSPLSIMRQMRELDNDEK